VAILNPNCSFFIGTKCRGLHCAETCCAVVRHLMMGIRSEKCVVRRFCRRASIIECT